MLVECAGEVIPELAKASGGQPFLAHLGTLLPPILAKLVGHVLSQDPVRGVWQEVALD
jgi:hypothetical protein